MVSAEDICLKNNNTIYGIDPWDLLTIQNGVELFGNDLQELQQERKVLYENLLRVLEKFSYSNIHLIKDFSANAVKRFEDNNIDILYIDGDHSYDYIIEDLNLWYPKLKSGGTFFGDDWTWESVRKAVEDFTITNNLSLSISSPVWMIAK